MTSRAEVVVVDDDVRVLESIQSLFEAANLPARFFHRPRTF